MACPPSTRSFAGDPRRPLYSCLILLFRLPLVFAYAILCVSLLSYPFSPYIARFPPATLDFRIPSLLSFNLPHRFSSLVLLAYQPATLPAATVCI